MVHKALENEKMRATTAAVASVDHRNPVVDAFYSKP
jgi:hypothetical protein